MIAAAAVAPDGRILAVLLILLAGARLLHELKRHRTRSPEQIDEQTPPRGALARAAWDSAGDEVAATVFTGRSR